MNEPSPTPDPEEVVAAEVEPDQPPAVPVAAHLVATRFELGEHITITHYDIGRGPDNLDQTNIRVTTVPTEGWEIRAFIPASPSPAIWHVATLEEAKAKARLAEALVVDLWARHRALLDGIHAVLNLSRSNTFTTGQP